ncbi:transcription factor PAP1-domain-containing protein [Coniochaeta sp. 2T2.1]|nr:transcription factor PAP1-domain-containing protein [Coniochaeta sp. 2T2.1]
MTSIRNNPLGDLVLTPQQQSLLYAALNSNKANGSPMNNGLSMSPSNFDGSPANHGLAINDSPLLDFDYEINNPDSSFDFSFDNGNDSRMIGDLPGAPSTARSESASDQDSPDKRSHPDDDEEENGAKRRESEDKVSKKPGRKPLTTEPTSKRKAQNRAAQRAFRERKERHLKDLETKVQELEKASEQANNENELLKQRVEKMTVELNEYKKRVSLAGSTGRSSAMPSGARPFGTPIVNNINDVNFQFEFPKFGVLPGPISAANHNNANTNNNAKDSISPVIKRSQSDPSRQTSLSPGNSSSYSQIGLDSQMKEDLANIGANMFNPLMPSNNGSRTSFDSHPATTTSSPSASSNSNMGASSSCGTSPEPYTQSPTAFKPVDTLTTIGEESATLHDNDQGLGHFSTNMTDFNWLPQTNFQFDPQLFGGYREPQENILSTGFDDSFFNDAFDADFITPYNVPVTTNAGNPKKPGLIEQIDAAKNTDELDSNGNLLTCNKIWEKLQNCPKVQNGDFDLDGLCSELQKKAKCSGSGAVVDERDFKTVMRKYLGSTEKEIAECDAREKAMEARKASGQKA